MDDREMYMAELHKLSRLVIEVLDQQKKYFKTRLREDLIQSKKMEADLRAKAKSYLEVDQL